MFYACDIDVSYYDDRLNETVLKDSLQNPYIITTDDDIKNNAINMPASIERKEQLNRRICNAFKNSSDMTAKLIFSRFFRPDKQLTAKNNLGNDFGYIANLYDTFSKIKAGLPKCRGPRNSIYIIYKILPQNSVFDMKSALDTINVELKNYINKTCVNQFINEMFDVVYPSYFEWRWRTRTELTAREYANEYNDSHKDDSQKHHSMRNGSSFNITIDKLVEECDNLGKELVDFKKWDLVYSFYNRIKESVERTRDEARVNFLNEGK